MAAPNYERYCDQKDDGRWEATVQIRFTSMLLEKRKTRCSLGVYQIKEDAVAAVKSYFDGQDKRFIVSGDYVALWNRMEHDYKHAQELRYKSEAKLLKNTFEKEKADLNTLHAEQIEKMRLKHVEEVNELNKQITTLEHRVKFAKWG